MSATATSSVLDSSVDLIVPLDPVLQLLHRQQLSYKVRRAQPVLRSDAAAGLPPGATPDVCVLEPFCDEPVLAVGNRVVPPTDFTMDNEGIRWATGTGADRTTGSLHFGNRGITLAGLVTTATSEVAVEMDLQTVYFDCELSANAGAHVALGGDNSIELHTEGVSWDSATWVAAGLRYGYAVTADGGIGQPPVIESFFVDTATGVTWQPSGLGTLVDETAVLSFDAEGETPPPDARSSLPPEQRVFGVVFPTRMVADFAGDGATFEGAMVVDETANPPLVFALRGSFVDEISSRLVAPEPQGAAVTEAAAVTLTDTELANFRPFVQVDTPTGSRWQEVVRPKAVDDFNLILKTFVPDELAGFVGQVDPVTKRPILPPMDAEVQRISQLPGADGTVAWQWYMDLAVPYLTGALSTVTGDPGAPLLNAKRARTWMRTVMPSASVYQVQMPALYAYRYGKNNTQGQNPRIQDYLDDQATTGPNHAAHAAEVVTDAANWKQQTVSRMTDVKPEDVKAFTDIVDQLSALGAADCYWAYRLFRFATSPAALAEIHGLSLSPAQDSSLLAVRVQSTCATLSVLDPSGTFAKQYMKVISLVQLTNVLPQLLDYAGYADSIRAIVPQLLEDFITRHLDSADPDIQQAVRDLQAADQNDAVLELVNDILGVAAAMTGAYNWTRLVAKLGAYPAGITKIAGAIIIAAVAAAGLALFVYGCLHFSSLTHEAQANLIAGAIQIMADMAISILKFGSQVSELWSPGVSVWERMVAILNPFKDEVESTTAGLRRRLAQRIMDRANEGDYINADTWIEMQVLRGEEAEEVAEEVAEDPGPGLPEFGLNIESVEMGVGFVFALFNVIMSAIALSETSDPLDVAQNALFLASSVLEGVAYGVGLTATFVVDVTLETAAVVASFMSACTFCASILAVIGLAITAAILNAPHDTPIQTFAKGAAADEGYAMLNPPAYAIESFEAYAPGQGPSLTAVTVSGSGSGSSVLRVATDGSLGYGPPDGTSPTCWYLTVDGGGLARLSSADPVSGKVVCLAVDKAGQLAVAPVDTSSTGQPQLWVAALQAAPTTNATGPIAGVFRMWSAIGAPARYLDLSGPQPRVSLSPTDAVLVMTTMKPQGLTMSDMVLSTADLDRVFIPQLVVPGSTPATWSLSPAPPAWLTLDPATGVLTQALGMAPPLTSPSTFTLTCDNQVGRAQATFTVQVKAPAVAAV